MKGKVAAIVLIAFAAMFLAAGGTVRVSDLLISHAVINATPEEVIAWMSTDGEGVSINKKTQIVTNVWWPKYESKPIDGLPVGGSYSYTLEYAGVKFAGEAMDLGPQPIRPGVPTVYKYSGNHDATMTVLIVPVKEGAKLILVAEYALDAPAGLEEKIKKDIDDHMQNAVKIIKDGVEKKKAAAGTK